MLIKNWMSRPVITVNISASMQDAMDLLKQYNIRKLPVENKGKLVGLITDGDIKKASASNATTLEIHELMYAISKIKAKDIMTKKVITAKPDQTIDELAQLLLTNKITCAPVLDDKNKLVGIITEEDIFKALISLTGIDKKGIQFAFILSDNPGSIRKITDILRKYSETLASILSSYDNNAPKNYRNVYIRVQGVEREKLEELKKELNANLEDEAKLSYIIDYNKGTREIF
jgi:acetoin utilization protein AcuB